MSKLNAVLAHIETDMGASLNRLMELLRIESISTDPEYAGQCRIAADWLVEELDKLGFRASRRDTTGHPMVVAHYDVGDGAPEGSPHVLFYGHYDVQPVDPLDLWKKPPFEPEIYEDAQGRKVIHGRGSSDDKGQLMTFVEACRAWKQQTGHLPCRVTILFEGEEESGSPSLVPFLEAHKDELSTDFALICDTTMWDEQTPAISTSLRGMTEEEVIIKAASRDLHSGFYGGPAANPIRVLGKIIGDMHDDEGKVTLEGFYEGVAEVPDELKAQWDDLGFDQVKFLGGVGLAYPAGEVGYSVLEQKWSRPTAEVNGIIGGYTGEGFKTVIPAQASAKISFRLVGKQDPEKVRSAFRAHVNARLPKDCEAEFINHGGSPAIEFNIDKPELKKATAALKDEWQKDTALIAMGGSIPIGGLFQSILDIDSLLIGFAHADDQIHSPNEKYNLESFTKGTRSWARILAALAE
jgi:acetylornithine deacetylase/succinyl-diaminopimelate desuccinylase-like protein